MSVSHPVARTAFYCCALRANDAAGPRAVCGDTLAARFLDDEARRSVEPLLRLRAPAASNVARHRVVDDLLRRSLAEDPSRRVILLGAGFDTRAFRLSGGRWWEIDDAQLLEFKEARLPASTAPNPLTRVPVDFVRERVADRLAPLAGSDRAVVVLEGVTMYLDEPVLAALAVTLRDTLPAATVICDLMSPGFARTFSRPLRSELARLGATFASHARHPRHLFEAAGYAVVERYSIPGRARDEGTLKVPGWLFHTALRGLRDGYALYVFRQAQPR